MWWKGLFANRASSAWRDWLGPWLDTALVRQSQPDRGEFWLYEVDAGELPREWLRWTMLTLQGTRKVTTGTPIDNQIAAYLLDADVFVTADKGFAAMVERVRAAAAFPMAAPLRVPADPSLLDSVAAWFSKCQRPTTTADSEC